MEEKFCKILRLMAAHGENRFCFDCHQRGPTYVNMTIGSFVCTSCGGALRKYSHRIKSISMSNFSLSEMDFLRKRGNKACRQIYLATNEQPNFAEKDVSDTALDWHLRKKYQLQLWFREPTVEIEREAIEESRTIFEQFDRTNMRSCLLSSFGSNTAAGHIISGSRQLPSQKQVSDQPQQQTKLPQEAREPVNGTATSPKSSPVASVSSSKSMTGFPTDFFQPTPPKSTGSQDCGLFAADPFGSSFFPQNSSEAHFANFPSSSDLFHNASTTKSFVPQSLKPVTVNSTSLTTPFDSAPFNPQLSCNLPATTVDKYAALAELDGLFKNACIQNDGSVDKPIATSSPVISYPNAFPSSYFSTPSFAFPVLPGIVPQRELHNPFLSSPLMRPEQPKHYSASNPFVTPQTTAHPFALASSVQPPFSAPIPASVSGNQVSYSQVTSTNPFIQTANSAVPNGCTLHQDPFNLWPSQCGATGTIHSWNPSGPHFERTNGSDETPHPSKTPSNQAFADFVPF